MADYREIAETYRTRNREITRAKEAEANAAYLVYSEAVAAAETTRNKARDEATAVYTKARDEAADALSVVNKEIDAKALKASEELLEELTKESADGVTELFSWMVSGSTWWRRFPGHCQTILENMPLDLAGLRKLSDTHGWCSDFDAFLREALVADVIPGVPVTEAVEYTLTTVMDNAGLGSRSQETIRGLVGRLVKLIPAEAAEAKPEETAAEAEPVKAEA